METRPKPLGVENEIKVAKFSGFLGRVRFYVASPATHPNTTHHTTHHNTTVQDRTGRCWVIQ